MIQLITISDVRKFRQIGKQINTDDFNSRANNVQKYQLKELLKDDLYYDFFDFLTNNWTLSAETFNRINDNTIEAVGIDLSMWVDYSLKINSNVFVIVKSAAFSGGNTTLIVDGYETPTTITTIEYKAENNYIKLLNGTTYIYNDNNIIFEGLRGFLSWHLIARFTTDGDTKHSDVGNINITGELFQKPGHAEKNRVISEYLQDATREENSIIKYLNCESDKYPLWISDDKKEIMRFNIFLSD